MLMDSLDEQVRRIHQLQADIDVIERRLSRQMREIPACKAVAEIPGVGLLTATAIVASIGTPTAFKDTREFAAWIGLVPRQTGTGGRVRQLGISKRGDAYLRTLLMHGARAIVVRSKDAPTWPWLAALLQRRPYSVVVAAVANKLARTIWAVLARGQAWRPEKPSIDLLFWRCVFGAATLLIVCAASGMLRGPLSLRLFGWAAL